MTRSKKNRALKTLKKEVAAADGRAFREAVKKVAGKQLTARRPRVIIEALREPLNEADSPAVRTEKSRATAGDIIAVHNATTYGDAFRRYPAPAVVYPTGDSIPVQAVVSTFRVDLEFVQDSVDTNIYYAGIYFNGNMEQQQKILTASASGVFTFGGFENEPNSTEYASVAQAYRTAGFQVGFTYPDFADTISPPEVVMARVVNMDSYMPASYTLASYWFGKTFPRIPRSTGSSYFLPALPVVHNAEVFDSDTKEDSYDFNKLRSVDAQLSESFANGIMVIAKITASTNLVNITLNCNYVYNLVPLDFSTVLNPAIVRSTSYHVQTAALAADAEDPKRVRGPLKESATAPKNQTGTNNKSAAIGYVGNQSGIYNVGGKVIDRQAPLPWERGGAGPDAIGAFFKGAGQVAEKVLGFLAHAFTLSDELVDQHRRLCAVNAAVLSPLSTHSPNRKAPYTPSEFKEIMEFAVLNEDLFSDPHNRKALALVAATGRANMLDWMHDYNKGSVLQPEDAPSRPAIKSVLRKGV